MVPGEPSYRMAVTRARLVAYGKHPVTVPWRPGMSFLKRLFSSNPPAPMQRVRICVECGMPVAEHKDWCSILRGEMEMERRKAERQ